MEEILREISVIIIASALFSYLAARTRQPIIVGYILAGVVFGPEMLGRLGDVGIAKYFWVSNVEFISTVSKIGITLLLFLAGITLHPKHLLAYGKTTLIVSALSCVSSFFIAFLICVACNLDAYQALFVGLALMFSSTILVVKLLPTTTLHQERLGALCISILIIEDFIAVGVLVLLKAVGGGEVTLNILRMFGAAAALLGVALFAERYLIRAVMRYLDRFHEALFVVGLGWCLAIAALGTALGLLPEIGAFFAGLALARQKVSLFLSEKLKPLRDFFLLLFFFALGAELDIFLLGKVVLPAFVLASTFLLLKPLLFYRFFILTGLDRPASKEASIRLGQLSEFSLLIAIVAFETGVITSKVSHTIQLATIITMLVSSYIVIYLLPTPIAVSPKLRKD